MGLGSMVQSGLADADRREQQERMERRAKRRARVQGLKERGVIGDQAQATPRRAPRERRAPGKRTSSKGGAIGGVVTVIIVLAIIALKVWARSN